MWTSFSSNAILAKAMTMYGRHLDAPEYTDLLHCPTVTDVAVYLKKKPAYAKTLASMSETTVHRGQLEALLKAKLFDDFAALCRYELSVGKRFSDYLIRRGEINQILSVLRLLSAGRSHEYLSALPLFFNRHTELDLFSLAKVKTFAAFLDALGHSKYRSIIEKCCPDESVPPDFNLIENALFIYLYTGVFAIIRKHVRGEEKEELLAVFGQQVDLLNMLRIDRLKRYFHASSDMVRSMIIPFHYKIPPRVLNEMIEAHSADDAFDLFRRTSYRKILEKHLFENPDDFANRCQYDLCRKKMYFSTHASVVMLSYIFLAEIELENMVKIIEGIRYGLPQKEIAGMLIGYEKKT